MQCKLLPSFDWQEAGMEELKALSYLLFMDFNDSLERDYDPDHIDRVTFMNLHSVATTLF